MQSELQVIQRKYQLVTDENKLLADDVKKLKRQNQEEAEKLEEAKQTGQNVQKQC